MAEYIERAAAINKILGYIVNQNCHDVALHNIGIRKALSAIDSLPAADVVERPRWIPVEERLPEVGEKVLICHSHEGHKSISICSLRKSFLRDDELGGFIAWSAYTKNVTHWMPLPEPPEREVGHK